ncbi:DNA-3-methyladenine glycosylase [Knoellia flava TL1]|uniref:DNA-3-methyladenine glycosylase n=2 Tax=Knoellia flava TaxID=913969 RepID=A0A8H9FUZ8_9MICO|nr:AlkA N-terminal domain-containing protein [Knoellia flava]KGN32206.1 DNA-3-methyladenine glycosylase [Knoellia flava TL1]GGB89552.1 DNA-3-methyladenine glycosylase [Knoellia flava]
MTTQTANALDDPQLGSSTSPGSTQVRGAGLGFDAMYAAITGRDRRFDGTFYTAVHTTGIYCRPSCPARKPHARNVTFYPSAAAAQSSGYRACRRCVPEALPGSPWWNIPGSVAARALQLIEQGVVDEEGVNGLARRLGWSTRSVSRLLVEHTGASPIAHARARRARVAHALITGTDQPFSAIAFAAGFSSLRQFNDTVLTIYGTSPSRLRGSSASTAAAGAASTAQRGASTAPDGSGAALAAGTLRATLAYRPPLDWTGLLRWFEVRALAGTDRVTRSANDAGSYVLALALPHGAGVATLADDPDRSRVRADLDLEDLRDYGPACAVLRRLLDLDADPAAVDGHLGGLPALHPLVAATPGIRLPGAATPLEALLRALTGQQVSVAAGRAQLERLVLGSGDDDGATLRPFPTAAALLASGLEGFRGPAARRATLGDALRLADDGALDPARDPSDVADDLRRVKGVGGWTIAYTLLRGYGHPDVDLSTDRAVVDAATALGAGTPGTVLADATPWRSYAALHLWRLVA